MASDQSVDAGSQPSPQTIGNVFIEQYYGYLLHSPQTVYQFYKENSHLGRLGPNGTMEYVTTIEAINEKILAMDISEFGAEIKTVDAQHSLNGGVVVLVTGYHTGKDSVKKHFTQLFFLAPMDKAGYFVLNDIFRYVDEAHHLEENAGLANGTVTPQTIEQDSAAVHELPVQEQTPPPTLEEEEEEEEDENGEEVYSPPDKETDSVNVEEEVPIAEVIDEVPSVSPAIDEVPSVSPAIDEVPSISEVVAAETSCAATAPVEAPKKSYASIVKVMRENPAPLTVAPPAPVRQVHIRQERRAAPFPAPVPVSDVSTDSSNATESNVVQESEDGYSVFVKSLPLSATPAQLEEEFKKFGPIKPGGIQVRSHKMQGFCFGFVEFEVASAVQSAIEASPVTIGGRQAFVEEKRTAGTRANNRGRYAPGRGAGFRGDGVRGRGSYGGGRGYGRADYSNRSDFGSRGGAGAGRGGSFSRGTDIGYQRVDHTGSNGGGRGGRSESFAGNSSPKSDPSSARPCLEMGE